MTVTQTLGAFTAHHDAPSAALLHAARRALLNHLGCAMGVAQDTTVRAALSVMLPSAGAPAATVIGQATRTDPMTAAFVNAIAANLLDYDDTHLATVIHPAAPIFPPLLALAEQRGLSGTAVLHAFLLGGEVACRIGLGVSPGHYDRGWHITATTGVLGAAAGCARLLGLDAVRSAHAIGLAASLAGSIVENLPTAGKNLGVGNAARHGLQAALFAEAGWQAAPTAIEGSLGWARAMGDAPDLAAMLEGLGDRWEIARNTFKPYPAGIVFHAVIDAAIALREAASLDAITAISVAGDALLLARGDRVVSNARDARVSIHHCVALGLVRGTAGVADFEEPAVADPALAAMRARVRAELDPTLPRGAARVTLTLADGRSLTHTVETALGSEAKPLSDGQLEAKFLANAPRAGAAIAAIWGDDLPGFMAALG